MSERDGQAVSTTPRSRVHMHSYESQTQWTWGAAVAISSALACDLQQQARARLLLSGGSTPAPVYEALSKAPLDWERVDVALVDERWLLPDDPDSNSRLIRESLLRNNAAKARFESITRPGRSIEEAVNAANLHAQAAPGVMEIEADVLVARAPSAAGIHVFGTEMPSTAGYFRLDVIYQADRFKLLVNDNGSVIALAASVATPNRVWSLIQLTPSYGSGSWPQVLSPTSTEGERKVCWYRLDLA